MSKLPMAMALLLLAGCEGTTPEPATPQPRPIINRRCPPPRQRVVDLTQPLHEAAPIFPGGVPFKMTRLSDYEQGYRLHKFEMGENTGTHVDAPGHFVQGKRSIGEIPVDELVLPAVVIDVRDKAKSNPDYALSFGDVSDWEAAHGEIPIGSLVIANTGWHARYREPARYLNQDAEGVMHFPGFSPGAVQLLIERDVAGIAIDTLSLDPGASKGFEVHKLMLAANKYQIENLANLDVLPPTGTTVVVGVLPVAQGSQAQARVIGIIVEKEDDAREERPVPSHGH